MNILIAPNSFKECAESIEIAEIINSVFSESLDHKLIIKPLSDGGDGFLNVCKSAFKLQPLSIIIKDGSNDEEIEYTVLIDPDGTNIFIESAELFGLKLSNEKNRNPLKLDSAVLGKIIAKILEEVSLNKLNIQNVWIGVGGTATIDFGIGTCSQLGLSLFDGNGQPLKSIPQNFSKVSSIIFNKPNLPFQIKCVVDVDTTLIGEPGAIEIYGPQKGASSDDIKIIKEGIKNILSLISSNNDFKIPETLNGAGGGLAAGLKLFFDAEIIPAKEFILKSILGDLDLSSIDAVITGEGNFDLQSFEGKGAGVLLNIFEKYDIPIFIICGSSNIPEEIQLSKNIHLIRLIDYYKSKEASMKDYRNAIIKAAKIVIDRLKN